VALVGVGRLGAALLGYKGFRAQGFRLAAAFDADPAKVGTSIEGVLVFAADKLEETVRREKIQMAIVTVPVAAAPALATRLAAAGVRSILNFAPVRLHVPRHVTVHYVDMAMELEKLSFLSTRTEKSE
jgi:redox-sensing transcriptional repressor